jgi:hypothetical protein
MVKGGSRAGSRVRPNFSDKQTFARQSGTSEKCQSRSFVHAVGSNRVWPEADCLLLVRAASGLYGFMRMSFGALCTLLAGLVHGQSAAPVGSFCSAALRSNVALTSSAAYRRGKAESVCDGPVIR